MKQDPLELDVQVPIILKIQNKAGLTGSYPAAILSTATLVPLLAAFLSVASYVIQVQPPWFALLSGSLIVALGWLLTAFYYRRNTAVDLADPSSYNFLLNNLREQERWFRIWESQLHTPESIINDTNLYEIQANFKTIASDLSVRNGSWAAGTGYINISRLMHRIGEAFLDIVPNESLIAEAFRAEAELTDSTMPNKDHLLTSLRIAVKMFGEQDVYLNQQPSPHQKDPPSKKINLRPPFMLEPKQDLEYAKSILHLTNFVMINGKI